MKSEINITAYLKDADACQHWRHQAGSFRWCMVRCIWDSATT